MPKISELPAATTVAGTELIAGVQGGTTKSFTTTQISGGGAYNVKNYGAVGDGSTNDTAAIQAAITAAGQAGGGIVYLPRGTYRIQPATISTTYALKIDYNNVHLVGAGMLQSKLDFRLYNGDDPASTVPPPLVSGAVQRGYGILIDNSSEPTPRTNIRLADFELDGNAGYTGSVAWPANPVTGTGWDITHKAILINTSKTYDDIIFENLYLHTWRGEVIYHGGNLLARFTLRNCRIGDNNGSAVALSATLLIAEGNEVYTASNAALEQSYFNGLHIYRNNYLHDIDKQGFNVYPAVDEGPMGFVEIYNNQVVRCAVNGVYGYGARNMRVYNNLFIDCASQGVYIQSPGLGGGGLEDIVADNVEVFGNRFVADAVNSTTAIALDFFGDTPPPSRIQIHDNSSIITQEGRTAGKTFARMLSIDSDVDNGPLGTGCHFTRNEAYSPTSVHSRTENKKFIGRLTTTGMVELLRVYDKTGYVRRVFMSWWLDVGPVNLDLNVKWYDYADVLHTKNITTGAQAVGDYSAMFEMMHRSSGGNSYIYVEAQASIADRIRVAVEIAD